MTAYKLGEILGKGGYGTVYEAKNMLTQEQVAIKVIRLEKVNEDSEETTVQFLKNSPIREKNEKIKLQTMNEIDILQRIKDNCKKYLLCIIDYFFIDNEIWIVTELLDSRYRDGNKILKDNEVDKIKLITNLAYAIQTLHTYNIYHGDIKLNNFMYTRDANIKLIDYGLACTRENFLSRNKGCNFTSATPGWLCPEYVSALINRKDITQIDRFKCDIFALGALFFYIIEGKKLFKDHTSVTENIRTEFNKASPILQQLISMMTSPIISERPDIASCVDTLQKL